MYIYIYISIAFVVKGQGWAHWTHFGLGLIWAHWAHLGLGHVLPVGCILASRLLGPTWDQFSPKT